MRSDVANLPPSRGTNGRKSGGRTGIVVGCYLIRHGLIEKVDVFEKIKLLRGDGKDIPITEEQNQFVLSWEFGM